MVALSEIEGAHGLPIEDDLIVAELQSVFESVKARPTCK